MRRLFLLITLSVLALPAFAQQQLPVVASFSILGDLVSTLGGERVLVTTIVGPNADAHGYQPKPADAKAVAQAKLIVVNGLGFDNWMQRLHKSAGSSAPILVASTGITPLKEATDGHGHGDVDPHAWHDIANLKLYAKTISAALSKADPAGAPDYADRLTAYLANLDRLESEIKATIATIPPARRKIVTSHDAFGYFGRAYGIVFLAPQGVSTESQPSARDVARIIRFIKESGAPAVFIETIADPRQMERIAAESGARLGGKLYSDALSPQDGPAGTTIDMIRTNIRELSKALGPQG